MADYNEEAELYDEFGNYIGPDLDSDDEDDDEGPLGGNANNNDDDDDPSDVSEDDDDNNNNKATTTTGAVVPMDTTTTSHPSALADPQSAIVLHEDKEHYPSADEVYGDAVRTAVLDEDAVDIDTPLVQPLTTQSCYDDNLGEPQWLYDDPMEYLRVHLSNDTTRTRRGVAVVGHLHHGKTSLVDLLLEPLLENQSWGDTAAWNTGSPDGGGPRRYTDVLVTERQRHTSLVSTPLTTLLHDTRGKSYGVTLVDCPGHVQLHDETVASLRLVDGALVVVDVVEGVRMHTEMVLKQIILEGLPLILVVSKLDRLIVELKLPPRDAYYKLLHVIDSVNELVQQHSQGRYPIIGPHRGNVAFSSAQHGYVFTLESWARLYADQAPLGQLGDNLSLARLVPRMWGEAYLDPHTKTFHTTPHDCPSVRNGSVDQTIERTFVALVLEPLYKVYSACLAEPEATVQSILRDALGVYLKTAQLRASARPLLRNALQQWLQATAQPGLVDAIVRHIPCPAVAAPAKVRRLYTGPAMGKYHRALVECPSNGPLVMHAVKQYPTADGRAFLTLCRIYSGTVRPATRVRVLGETYHPHDHDEDCATGTVESVWIPRGPVRTEVSLATAGNWVLVQGIDATMEKTATIVGIDANNDTVDMSDEDDECYTFRPLQFPFAGGAAVMKLAVEPLNPAELPKMVEGLRRISKAYPMARTKVEESGEHVVLGTGELYMDCLLHDLRHVYSDIEVKVADPLVAFCETVVDTSSIKCFSQTANKRNKLTFLAEPLDDGLAEQLERGKVNPQWDTKKMGRFFESYYHWDLLTSRSVWAFGASPTHGPNVLINDTLPTEVDTTLLQSCKSSMVQGFQWAMREGPLCEEPVRGSKIKLLDVTLADKAIYRGGGQVIPTARRTIHSSLLTGTPRLMEPVYKFHIECPKHLIPALQPVVTRRRGHIVQEHPLVGTTLTSVHGYLPLLDSFGLETDIRTLTQGQAMIFSVMDHWAVVPGDPLDTSVLLHPLEPSPPRSLAREILIKTRRRKGLSEDVSVSKFLDDAMKAQLLWTPGEQQQQQ